jgi:hypothetical protein
MSIAAIISSSAARTLAAVHRGFRYMSRTFTAPASAMTCSSTASASPLAAALRTSGTLAPATRPLASACKNQQHHQRHKQQLQPRAIGQAGKGSTWCVRRCGGANLDACYGGLQQARIRFKFSTSKRVQNNDIDIKQRHTLQRAARCRTPTFSPRALVTQSTAH